MSETTPYVTPEDPRQAIYSAARWAWTEFQIERNEAAFEVAQVAQ